MAASGATTPKRDARRGVQCLNRQHDSALGADRGRRRRADVCDSWVLEFGCVALRAFFSKLFDEAPSDAEAPLVLFAEGVAWSPCDLDLFARRFFLLSLSFLPLLGFSSGVVEA